MTYNVFGGTLNFAQSIKGNFSDKLKGSNAEILDLPLAKVRVHRECVHLVTHANFTDLVL